MELPHSKENSVPLEGSSPSPPVTLAHDEPVDAVKNQPARQGRKRKAALAQSGDSASALTGSERSSKKNKTADVYDQASPHPPTATRPTTIAVGAREALPSTALHQPLPSPTASSQLESTSLSHTITTKPGGYEDEESIAELSEDRAALQDELSHSADVERHTGQTNVQIEVVDTSQVSVSAVDSSSTNAAVTPAAYAVTVPPFNGVPKTSTNWQMKDLEAVLGPFISRFGLQFVPKLIDFTGTLTNGPWQLYGLDLPHTMQDLARSIWPELGGLTILPRQPFYELAKQKLSDYRNSVASEAVNAVNKFMRSARFKHSPADRAKWVAWALSEEHGFPFRYEKVLATHTGTTRKIGAYRHKLVVKTLAYHVKRVQKPVDQMREHPPHNALALAVTAVERALKMWESGEFIPPKSRAEENKFSDRLWGRTANQYMGSIVSLSEEQWEGILQLTEQHARGLVPDCDDDGSDTDTGDYDPSAIPTSGGRATIEEDCEFDEPQDDRPVNDGGAGRGRQ